jgi:hypothetical protein
LIEILLPVRDNKDRPFAAKTYQSLYDERQFGLDAERLYDALAEGWVFRSAGLPDSNES